jgi:hypothetical protein
LAPQEGDLLAKREVLQRQVAPGPQGGAQGRGEGFEDAEHNHGSLIGSSRKINISQQVEFWQRTGFFLMSAEVLDEQSDVDYVVTMAKNLTLEWKAGRFMRSARKLSRQSEKTEHVYGECRYRAKNWDRERRVIIKAEVVRHPGRDPKENPRFVITNLPSTAQWIYEKVYCGRGEIENRIKELHHGLEIDRISFSRFWANQLRVLLTAAAYVLMQELRLRAARTSCARAQVQTLRERLIKIGARVVESVRRIVLQLPASYPFLEAWRPVATGLGATAG